MTDEWSAGQVKEYVEALLTELQRARDMAERERDKAAETLATNLRQLITDGDERLLQHVESQVLQIRTALESAEKLELERFEAAKAGRAALEEKLAVIQMASTEAILKAEKFAEAQFEELRRGMKDLAERVGKVV